MKINLNGLDLEEFENLENENYVKMKSSDNKKEIKRIKEKKKDSYIGKNKKIRNSNK